MIVETLCEICSILTQSLKLQMTAGNICLTMKKNMLSATSTKILGNLVFIRSTFRIIIVKLKRYFSRKTYLHVSLFTYIHTFDAAVLSSFTSNWGLILAFFILFPLIPVFVNFYLASSSYLSNNHLKIYVQFLIFSDLYTGFLEELVYVKIFAIFFNFRLYWKRALLMGFNIDNWKLIDFIWRDSFCFFVGSLNSVPTDNITCFYSHKNVATLWQNCSENLEFQFVKTVTVEGGDWGRSYIRPL